MKKFAHGWLGVALAVIGFTAGYVIQTGHRSLGGSLFVSFGGAHWMPALAMLVAVAVVALSRWLPPRAVVAVALIGLGMAAGVALLPLGADTERAVHAGVAGGIILGSATVLAAGRRWATASLAGGVLAAFLLADRIDAFRMMHSRVGMPRRYADYTSATSGMLDDPLPLLVIAVAAVAALTCWTLATTHIELEPTALLSAVCLAGGLLVVDTALGLLPVGNGMWIALSVVTVGLVCGAAWLLRDRAGTMLLAGLAVAAAAIPRLEVADGSWLSFALAATLLAIGLVVGLRWNLAFVGVGLCALVAIGGAWSAPGGNFAPELAYLLLLPFAAGLLVGSVLVALPTTTSSALSLPFAAAVFGPAALMLGGADYGWTAYTPLVEVRSPSMTATVVVATATVLICGAGIALLNSRQSSSWARSRPR